MEKYLSDIKYCQDFCNGHFNLYHAVPKDFVHNFECGNLIFRSADFLRKQEDEYECSHFNAESWRDENTGERYIFEKHEKKEYFLFCMSTNSEIKNIRNGSRVLYRVKLDRFISAVIYAMKSNVVSLNKPEKFTDGKKYKGVFYIIPTGAEVLYNGKDDIPPNYPWQFIKSGYFHDEHEVRLAFQVLDKGRPIHGSINRIHNVITSKTTGYLGMKINPSCFEKI